MGVPRLSNLLNTGFVLSRKFNYYSIFFGKDNMKDNKEAWLEQGGPVSPTTVYINLDQEKFLYNRTIMSYLDTLTIAVVTASLTQVTFTHPIIGACVVISNAALLALKWYLVDSLAVKDVLAKRVYTYTTLHSTIHYTTQHTTLHHSTIPHHTITHHYTYTYIQHRTYHGYKHTYHTI